jgi:hypothetical protein
MTASVLVGGGGVAAIVYADSKSAISAGVAGVLSGVGLAGVSMQQMRGRRLPGHRRVWRTHFPAVCAVIALSLALLGVLEGSLGIALASLPFFGLATFFVVAEKLARKGSSDHS